MGRPGCGVWEREGSNFAFDVEETSIISNNQLSKIGALRTNSFHLLTLVCDSNKFLHLSAFSPANPSLPHSIFGTQIRSMSSQARRILNLSGGYTYRSYWLRTHIFFLFGRGHACQCSGTMQWWELNSDLLHAKPVFGLLTSLFSSKAFEVWSFGSWLSATEILSWKGWINGVSPYLSTKFKPQKEP